MEDITKEDYVAWRNNEVTKAFFNDVSLRMQEIRAHLARGGCSDFEEYSSYVGEHRALGNVLNIEFNEIEEVKLND